MTTLIRSWHPGDPKPVGVTRLRIPRNTPPPFARRLLAKQLPPKEVQTFMHDGCGPDDSGRAA